MEPPLQDFPGRQFRQVLSDSNAATLELQQFGVLVRLAGAEDETQSRFLSGLAFGLFEPTEIEFHLFFVGGAEAA